MKEFNLNEYLKDLSQKVVTKDGRKVRIICTDAKNEFPIITLITNDDKEVLMDYNNNGKVSPDEMTDLDLFFEPIKREGWVNIFDNFPKENHDYYCDNIYKTKEDAEKDAKKYNVDNYVTTTKIEWEE